MTHHETPDPLGFLFSDLTGDSGTESTQIVSATSAQSIAPVTTASSDGSFPTRRELRMQREAAAREAASAAMDSVAQDTAEESTVGTETAPANAFETIVAEPVTPVVDVTPVERVVVGNAEAPVESALTVGGVPAIPVAPVAVVVDTRAEPEALAPRSRRGKPARGAARPPREPRIRSAADSAKRRSLRQRITGTATMVLVGGIFASLTLPAYAFPPQENRAAVVEDTATQNLAVHGATAEAASARDGYGATSFTDLRAAYAASIRQANGKNYLISTARALGDDYPWYDQLTNNQGGGLSPLRYYYRECVDFVAWRLNRDAGSTSAPFKYDWSTLTPGNGNASGWKSAWIAHGWTTSTTPVVGSVAWFPYNHVAYVDQVLSDGTVLLEEYNYDSDHMYGQRIVQASSVSLFLYPPPR